MRLGQDGAWADWREEWCGIFDPEQLYITKLHVLHDSIEDLLYARTASCDITSKSTPSTWELSEVIEQRDMGEFG